MTLLSPPNRSSRSAARTTGSCGPTQTLYDRVAATSAAAVIAGYSSSFALAARLLAQPVRTDIRNVYALVRIADEVVDDPASGLSADQREAALALLEQQTLDALSSGHSTNLVVHAFAWTARRCGIGDDLVVPFFASMRTDLSVTSHDAASLERYVYGSAEVVGLMCLKVFVTDPRARVPYEDLREGAQRLGAAFQKLNFLRDLGSDRKVLGRSYLLEPHATRMSDAERTRLLDDVDADLSVAAGVIPLLPASSRCAVGAAHALFAALSRRLRAAGVEDLGQRRVRVSGVAKVALVAGAVVRSLP